MWSGTKAPRLCLGFACGAAKTPSRPSTAPTCDFVTINIHEECVDASPPAEGRGTEGPRGGWYLSGLLDLQPTALR